MTVFVAAHGFAARVKRDWMPINNPLDVTLNILPDGGTAIFENGTGHIYNLEGRLNPILDTQGRTYLYADNIAINGGLQQPVPFTFGEELELSDADGRTVTAQIVDIVGQASLVQWRINQGS